MDIHELIRSARDGHLSYVPDILQIFAYVRPARLLSLSVDGLAVPQVYAYDDLHTLQKSGGTGRNPSPVKKIGFQDVETYLRHLATLTGHAQDPDANYNRNFALTPLGADTFPGEFFLSGSIPDSQYFTLFQNGTTRLWPTYAVTAKNFTGVTDGLTFFQRFCTGPRSTESTAPTPSEPIFPVSNTTDLPFAAVPSQTAVPAMPGYPGAWVAASDSSVTGYFPREYADLAVLVIPTFAAGPNEWRNVVREFLATARAKGKTRLQIDLRGMTTLP